MWRGLGCVALVGLVGCVRLNPLYADAQDASATGSTTDDPVDTTEPDPDTAGPGSTSSSGSSPDSSESESRTGSTDATDSGTTGTMSATSGTTGVSSDDCSTFIQDCADGEKCMPYAEGGGDVWDALGCFPLDPAPVGPGEACEVFGPPTSGMDDCDERSMCWDIDVETNTGTCVSFCTGSPGNPACAAPDELCLIANEGVIAVCLDSCDPLEQGCDPGLACLPSAGGFTCTPDASGGMTMVGDPCKFVNQCGAGFACADGEAVGCPSAACCTSFCDLLVGDACLEPLVCLPFFEPAETPAGYENVGVCVL